MKEALLCLVLAISISAMAAELVNIGQLQGAWWSDAQNHTADFAIQGNRVWLDYDAQYHPCKIEGDLLIFELGGDLDPVKNRIVSLSGNQLTLENLLSRQTWVVSRETP